MALALSILALLATFYQAYLQRIHNQKSVKPLVQVDLTNRDGMLAVHVRNNGIGPFIIKRLGFRKNGMVLDNIEECLSIDPLMYQSIPVTKYTPKTILPGTSFDMFSMRCGADEIHAIKNQLSELILTVEGVDIYDNTLKVERNFDWFSKY